MTCKALKRVKTDHRLDIFLTNLFLLSFSTCSSEKVEETDRQPNSATAVAVIRAPVQQVASSRG